MTENARPENNLFKNREHKIICTEIKERDIRKQITNIAIDQQERHDPVIFCDNRMSKMAADGYFCKNNPKRWYIFHIFVSNEAPTSYLTCVFINKRGRIESIWQNLDLKYGHWWAFLSKKYKLSMYMKLRQIN